jgi:hypothetical protein
MAAASNACLDLVEPMSHSNVLYLISCTHATCAVPEAYRELFKGAEDAVASTDGWEPGALNLAQAFSMKFHTPLVHGDVTRLLIDLDHDGDSRWSAFSGKLPEATRAKLVDRHERLFRAQLVQRIQDAARRHQPLLHVMIHSSPELDGRVLLESFPGNRAAEDLASAWRGHLRAANIEVMHLQNASPTALEGFLAGVAGTAAYVPVRLGVAQSFFLEGRPRRWEETKKLLLDSLTRALADDPLLSVQESRATGQD